MIKAAGKQVRLGGNIGTPALDLLQEPQPEYYVLELSSFQLETTSSLNAAAAVVLNVTEDHMDRYANLQEYAAAKQKVYNGTGAMIINLDDEIAVPLSRDNRKVIRYTTRKPAEDDFGIIDSEGGRYIACGEKMLCPIADLPLHGIHNVSNTLAALALGTAIGLHANNEVGNIRQQVSQVGAIIQGNLRYDRQGSTECVSGWRGLAAWTGLTIRKPPTSVHVVPPLKDLPAIRITFRSPAVWVRELIFPGWRKYVRAESGKPF